MFEQCNTAFHDGVAYIERVEPDARLRLGGAPRGHPRLRAASARCSGLSGSNDSQLVGFH